MIFSELYSVYYTAVARILAKAVEGTLTEGEMKRIVSDVAFSESAMTVLPSLKQARWQLLRDDLTTPLCHTPTFPLTLLEKQWLKAISLNSRVKLFGVRFEGLDGVEPLFTPDDYYIYDQYGDGDPFEDEGYIERFRLILDAIRNRYPLCVDAVNRRGNIVHMKLMPQKLEYSEKDDKLRLLSTGCRYGTTVNLGRITSCKRYNGDDVPDRVPPPTPSKTVTLLLYDDRNALERVMLHFAHFEKQAERIDEKRYRLTVRYDPADETELVIRILSFGPMVKVEAPQDLVELIKDRLIRQKRCDVK